METQPPRPQASAPRRVSTRSKWIGAGIVLLVLVAIGALAWYLLQRNSQTSGFGMGMGMRGGMASSVGIAKAEALDIPVTIEALGTVTPLATVTVRPQVSGVITSIAFREGQLVRKGELLAQIDPRPFENALLQAQGNLQRDQAQLENARLQLERYRTLQGQDSIAQQDVDTQAATVHQLEGTVAADRAAVASAKLDVEYSRVTAPVSGRVGLRVVDAGNYIAAGDANGIAVITQVAPIDVKFAVPQDSVGEILRHAAEGALPAVALDRTRTTELASGTFTTLDNQVDTSTGTVGGKARFDNADSALFPNQFVNLRLQLYTLPQVVAVPLSAVRNGASGDFVYVLNDDHTVSVRSVKRGAQAAGKVQISEGLKLGETVVTEGADRLKDGATVQLPGEAAKATDAARKADAAANPERRKQRRRPEGGPGGGPGGPGGPGAPRGPGGPGGPPPGGQ
ncbi:MdtA/MuxA family multidrug efflux RND transporter periplasmic adaptor subunit [Solimonas variicoloris]|uniref:MdtA/MuxA family multidrug efflux RND transporter periplasmic adaptor subunit n=1 Tax=Solimonas variicoloris TaxID=254408 RepID=UPI000365056E|nr:MdtA/MuxA family multidrug efflux RND transporter periplasmic adaptor subunit [Solimonas variicoloris]